MPWTLDIPCWTLDIRFLNVFVLVMVAAAVVPAQAAAPSETDISAELCRRHMVRVALGSGRKSFVVRFPNGYSATTPQRRVPLDTVRGPVSATITAVPGGIDIRGRIHKIYGMRLNPVGGRFELQGKAYAGTLTAYRKKGGTVLLVEELDVEEYLKGVLPQELPALWPIEVVKAQAVLSRTVALFKAATRAQKDFDLMIEGWAQRYGGLNAQHPQANAAIRQTRGQVLAYKGKIILPFFHANSGGATARPETIWEDVRNHPALGSVASGWSIHERHGSWAKSLTLDQITTALIDAGHRVGPLSDIRILTHDETGRAHQLLLTHLDGQLQITANVFRMAIGADRLRSTWFTQRRHKNTILFEGRGWGHGVGLCQWGARALGEKGKRHSEILAHYFPNAKIRTLYHR